MGFMSFVESLVEKIFQKDLNTITSFPMIIDPQASFAQCFCFVMPNAQDIYYGTYFCLQVFYNIDLLTL
jgi:hypothetical protein